MSLPISLKSENLITSLILQRVQMGVPNGTDWMVTIEWQMDQGHNSVIRRIHAQSYLA